MALFPLPLPASAGWSLISAGKGQKEGEAGEAGRGNKGRKVGRITHEDEKAEGRTAKMLTKSESDRAGKVSHRLVWRRIYQGSKKHLALWSFDPWS